jgi:hypothetical protein
MAFDHAAGRLNGIFDFGDSGFGPLHREFVQTSWVSPDLTERIVAEYQALTGRPLDRERIRLTTGVLRLSELGGFAGDAGRVAEGVDAVAQWAAYQRGHCPGVRLRLARPGGSLRLWCRVATTPRCARHRSRPS